MNDVTDQELLQAYATTGAEPAFARLVERHVDLVYSAAVRMVVDHHLAQDVTQAVFVALAQNAAKLRRCATLSGWLHATARNQAASLVRGEVRRRTREQNASDMNADQPEAKPEWDQIEPQLDHALGELPHADRDVLLLRFFERKSAREIGERLRLSEEAAQKRVRRALERLRLNLARRGVVSSTTAIAAALGFHAVLAAPVGLAAMISGHATAAGAAATAGSVQGLANILIVLMTTKKWAALGMVLLAGVALAPLTFREPPSPPQISVQFDPSMPPAPTLTSSNSVMKWADVESSDYRQFIANLRASGAPERLIRDAVGLEIYRTYLPRMREIWAQNRTHHAYWQRQSEGQLSTDQWKRLTDVLSECRAVLVTLFGPEARVQDALNVVTCQPDFDSLRLAWLPPDVEAKAAGILERIRMEAVARSSRTEETWAETQEAMERKLTALRPVLTPAQLEEFRMREDQLAQTLRSLTHYSDLSADEFVKFAKSEDPNLLVSEMTLDRQREKERRIGKLMGPDRARAILKTVDGTYACAQDAADAYGLPADTADRAWQLKWDAIAEHERLLKDEGLPDDARREQIKQLVDRTRATLLDLLGTNGFRLIQRDGVWLQTIAKR